MKLGKCGGNLFCPKCSKLMEPIKWVGTEHAEICKDCGCIYSINYKTKQDIQKLIKLGVMSGKNFNL